MTLENKILRDLEAGQASADSIAETLKLSVALVETILTRLVKEGKLTTGTIMNRVTVYRLDSLPLPR